MIYEQLEALLATYKPFNEVEAGCLKQFRQFFAESSNPFDRSNLVGHAVADAWVVSPDRKQVLLLVHGQERKWMAPGGHADGSPDLLDAATRELEEEAGLSPAHAKPLLGGALFDVNTGLVEARTRKGVFEPAHLHFDFCFAFEADPSVPLVLSDESLELAWKPVEEALKIMPPTHHRRAQKMMAGSLG